MKIVFSSSSIGGLQCDFHRNGMHISPGTLVNYPSRLSEPDPSNLYRRSGTESSSAAPPAPKTTWSSPRILNSSPHTSLHPPKAATTSRRSSSQAHLHLPSSLTRRLGNAPRSQSLVHPKWETIRARMIRMTMMGRVRRRNSSLG